MFEHRLSRSRICKSIVLGVLVGFGLFHFVPWYGSLSFCILVALAAMGSSGIELIALPVSILLFLGLAKLALMSPLLLNLFVILLYTSLTYLIWRAILHMYNFLITRP